MTDQPDKKTKEEPPEKPPEEPSDGTEPVLSDEAFAALDIDKDGVVHLQAVKLLDPDNPELPPAIPAKSKAGAPENKDAAALRSDKSPAPLSRK